MAARRPARLLGGTGPAASELQQDRPAEMSCEIVGLIEAALPSAFAVKRESTDRRGFGAV